MSDLWVEEAGPEDAPLVVFVHGSMDRSTSFAKVMRRLRDDLRVVTYDRRGYGRSVTVGGPFTMAHQLEDLHSVMADRAGVVVGHSYGGNVALAAAEARPDVVRGVGAFEPPMPWTDWWPTTSGGYSIVAQSRANEDPAEIAERFMKRMIGDERWERLPASTRAERRAEGPALIGEIVDLQAHPAFVPGEVAVPVVVARGAQGADHHRRSVEHLFSALPDPAMITIEDAGHGAHNSHPDEFAAFVRLVVARSGLG
jgi:pimeloyl-ACP methyl ester carboxylesterase